MNKIIEFTTTEQLKIINDIIQLFDKPEKWTTKSFARNFKNEQVKINAKDAYSFCLAGAIEKVTLIESKYNPKVTNFYGTLTKYCHNQPLNLFNDNSNYLAIMALLSAMKKDLEDQLAKINNVDT